MHLNVYLDGLAADVGIWIYVILFVVIFAETGLVVTPFLPGDSLLFAVGAIAAGGRIELLPAMAVMAVAAILGDTANYWIGHFAGDRLVKRYPRLIKQRHLDQTHEFFERYGGKTIILARFVPIVRTFAPFVAGIGAMTYKRFMAYNVVGALLWVGLVTPAGYFFGSIPVVKDNFTLVILGIVFVSILPGVFEFLKARRNARAGTAQPSAADRG